MAQHPWCYGHYNDTWEFSNYQMAIPPEWPRTGLSLRPQYIHRLLESTTWPHFHISVGLILFIFKIKAEIEIMRFKGIQWRSIKDDLRLKGFVKLIYMTGNICIFRQNKELLTQGDVDNSYEIKFGETRKETRQPQMATVESEFRKCSLHCR
jgi:hypothetical protein